MSAAGLGELEFSELIFRARMIERTIDAENKDRLTAAAYTAWLLGAGGDLSSIAYFRSLGLIEKEVVTEKQKKILTDKAKAIAERVMKMDRRPKGKK